MCCCHQHHNPHHRGHHHGEACGCGSHNRSCGETGHRDAHELVQVLESLQARVQAVEEQLAALEEA
jgi:hypothetical protein